MERTVKLGELTGGHFGPQTKLKWAHWAVGSKYEESCFMESTVKLGEIPGDYFGPQTKL